jgi:acid phosphatase (class A)
MRHARTAVVGCPLLAVAMLCLLWQAPAAAPGAAARDPHRYVQVGDFDFSTLLGGPPADNSPEHRAEIATMLYLQNRRTEQDVARCRQEANQINVWLFANVLGDDFNKVSHPLTAALFEDVRNEVRPIVLAAKAKWDRPRPYRSIPEIHPCVHLETGASFPSGHATLGMLWATVLAEIFPEQREAIMARGRQIGQDRFIAGVHYPSDVAAGQKLGAEIARRLLANRDFRIELDSVRREWGRAGTEAAPVIDSMGDATTLPAAATMP